MKLRDRKPVSQISGQHFYQIIVGPNFTLLPGIFFRAIRIDMKPKLCLQFYLNRGSAGSIRKTKFQMISTPCHRPVMMTKILGTRKLYPTYLVLALAQDKIKRRILLISILPAHCKNFELIKYIPG